VLSLIIEAVAVAASERGVGPGAAPGLLLPEGVVVVVGQQCRTARSGRGCQQLVRNDGPRVAQVVGQLVVLGAPAGARTPGPGSATVLNLALVAGQGKGHERGAVPDLLALRGALVSLDALSCQPQTAQQITAQVEDYLLGRLHPTSASCAGWMKTAAGRGCRRWCGQKRVGTPTRNKHLCSSGTISAAGPSIWPKLTG
jgi:hypothetical protein